MRAGRTIRTRRREAGIALLIAIFVLLLIGVVAIALIVSGGTETALAGNYRSSTSVYYAAIAGLEEVRSRLRPSNPNSFKNTAPSNFLPASGTPFGICNPSYVINPLGTENIAPWDTANQYYDGEYGREYSGICGSSPLSPPNPSPTAHSVWSSPSNPLSSLTFPGPLFKWVRINGVSEQSLNLDVDADNQAQSTTPLYFDNTNNHFSNNAGAGPQLLELTAFAVLPNGSQKLLQYLVAPSLVTLPPFLAALTLSGSQGGNSPQFQAPANNANYAVQGNGYDCSGNPTTVAAIGLFGSYNNPNQYNQDLSGIVSGIPTNVSGTNPQQNYTGSGPAPPSTNPPDAEYLSTFSANLQTPIGLDAIVQQITQNADVVLPSPNAPAYPLPTVTGSALNSLGMSSTNPLTVVINGNLDVTSWSGTGYGLLLVIGKFTYDPDTTWNGIILVIGQGAVGNTAHGQYQQINGAVFVAKTRYSNGNLITGNIGGGSVVFDDQMQGNGIRYSSCWIQKSQPTSSFRILSFHEISQ